MKKLMLIVSVLCILICNLAKAQLLPMDNGVNAPVVAAYSDDTNYYALCTGYGNYTKVYRLRIWNGTFWSSLPTFTANYDTAQDYVNIAKYKGDIYVGGTFVSVDGISNSSGIIKWDGTKWTNVDSGLKFNSSYPVRMAVYNAKLYVSGNYVHYYTTQLSNLYAWNGNSWNTLSDTIGKTGIKGRINSLLVNDGKLCVLGNCQINSDSAFNSILTWNDTSWSHIKTPARINTAYTGTLYNGNVYMFVNDTGYGIVPYTLDQYNWIMDTAFYKNYSIKGYEFNPFNYISDVKSFKNKLWFVGNFRNKVDHSNNALLVEYQNKVFSYVDSSIYIRNLTPYKNYLIASGTFVDFSGVTFNYVGAIANSSYLSGTVFIDKNSDCKLSSGQNAYGANLISIDSGKRYISLDSSGKFHTFIDSGAHTISLLPARYFKQSCPTSTFVFSKTLQPDSIYSGINFGSKPVPGIKDIKISLSGKEGVKFHPGYTNTYYLKCENIGTSTVKKCKIYFSHPTLLKNFAAKPVSDYYTSPQASWVIDSIEAGTQKNIVITLTSDTLLISDTLQFIARTDFTITQEDSNRADNADTLVQTPNHSWDPNEKQSFPFGDISENTKGIQYTIEFQNTGTAPAYQVVVIDTIDVSLPIDGITMIGSNHKYRVDINGNVLRWTFENINLPDSSQDEPNSHGYISYSATLKNGLNAGTVIKNKAYIYFDYNAPVITNQTSNTLLHNTITSVQEFVSPGNNALEIFPNPAQSSITLKGFGFKPGRAELYCRDMLGRTLFSYSLQAANDGTLQNMIDISTLRQGIYQIEVWQGSYKQEKKLIILK